MVEVLTRAIDVHVLLTVLVDACVDAVGSVEAASLRDSPAKASAKSVSTANVVERGGAARSVVVAVDVVTVGSQRFRKSLAVVVLIADLVCLNG